MGLVDWLFRDRRTGGYTVAQVPNWPLGVWLVATVLRLLLHPTGTAGRVLDVVGTGALLVWAVDEVVRGVNPWRRILGAVVGVAVVAGLLTR
jgi:hypothetical protein